MVLFGCKTFLAPKDLKNPPLNQLKSKRVFYTELERATIRVEFFKTLLIIKVLQALEGFGTVSLIRLAFQLLLLK